MNQKERMHKALARKDEQAMYIIIETDSYEVYKKVGRVYKLSAPFQSLEHAEKFIEFKLKRTLHKV